MLLLASEAGRHNPPERLASRFISEQQDIPNHYLQQILGKLRNAGLVTSTRGPSGGHVLAKEAHEITVGEVLACLEGEVSGVEGVLAMQCAIRVGPGHCVIKELLLKVKSALEDILYSTTLEDLAMRQAELSLNGILFQPRLLNPCGEEA